MLVEPSIARGPQGLECAVEERAAEGSRIFTGLVRGEHLELDAAPFAPSLAWEAGSVGAPALVMLDGRMTLFYEGGVGAGVGRAQRGAAGFEREATPLLSPRESFEEGRLGAPAVADGILYYEAGRSGVDAANMCTRDGDCSDAAQRCRQGRCRAGARLVAKVDLAAPSGPREIVLTPQDLQATDAGRADGSALWLDVDSVGSPGVVSVTTANRERVTLLFFTGVGRERADTQRNRSIGLALRVMDLAATSAPVRMHSYPFNPVIAESVLFTSPLGESGASPYLLDEAGALRVVFDRTEPSGAPGGLRLGRPEPSR